MRCPFCGNEETQVKDSRTCEEGEAVRRRRFCPNCDKRFTTLERVMRRVMNVIKRNGDKKIFNQDKLLDSITMATRKRNINDAQVRSICKDIVNELEGMGKSEIETKEIGELVMNKLKQIDTVSFVRFASVYKNFNSPKDFNEFIKRITK